MNRKMEIFMRRLGYELLESVRSQQMAEKSLAEANLKVLLNNPVGIGEHSDITAEVLCFVEKIAQADDNIGTVNGIIANFDTDDLEFITE